MALGKGQYSRWRGDDARIFDRVAAVRERACRLLPKSRAGWIYVELSLQSRRRRDRHVSRALRRFYSTPALARHRVHRNRNRDRALPFHAALVAGGARTSSRTRVLAALRSARRAGHLLSRGV